MSGGWECPLCKKKFSGAPVNTSLNNHLTLTHGYTKCANCPGNVFVNKHKLEEHLAIKHLDVIVGDDSLHLVGKRKVETSSLTQPSLKKIRGFESTHDTVDAITAKNSMLFKTPIIHSVDSLAISKLDLKVSRQNEDLSEKDVCDREITKCIDEDIATGKISLETGLEIRGLGTDHEEDTCDEPRARVRQKLVRVDLDKLSKGTYSRPSKYDKDPLANFWYAAIFECLKCPARPSRKFNSSNAWLQHVKFTHDNMTHASYKVKHGNPDITDYKHKCQLCFKTLSLKQSTVKKHLKVVHSIEIEEYNDQFRELLMSERSRRPLIPTQHALDGWWEGCMYSCKHCQFTAPGPTSLEHHLTLVHNIGSASQDSKDNKGKSVESAEPSPDLCSLTRFHQCHICSRVVRHDYRSIYHHLSFHKIDIEKYSATYRDKIICELREKKMEYVIEREEEIKNSPTLEEYLKRRKEEDLEQAESADDLMMKEWADYCEFKCSVCQEVVFSNVKLNLHVVRRHKLKNMKEYRAIYGDPESKHRLHKCFLCGCNIKWEATRIRDHLKCSHKVDGRAMTLKMYGEEFRDRILKEIKKLELMSGPEKDPIKLGQSLIGPSTKIFSEQEWREFYTKRLLPGDKLNCPLCKLKINRSSLNRHMQRSHSDFLFDNEGNPDQTLDFQTKINDSVVSKADFLTKVDDLQPKRPIGTLMTQVQSVIEDPLDGTEFEDVNLCANRFMIDQESGEILLFDGSQVSKKSTSDNLFILSADNSNAFKPSDDGDVIIEDITLSPEPSSPRSQSASELGSEYEFETGPLDGQIMEIDSPLQEMQVDYAFNDNTDPLELDDTPSIVQEVEDPVDFAQESSVIEVCVEEDEEEAKTEDEEEIVQQTIYVEASENVYNIVEDASLVHDDKVEGELVEGGKQPEDDAEKDLSQIILSNDAGVQQIAFVRVKGKEQKSLLEQISTLFNSEQKVFYDKSAGPLKIVEIEIDSRTGPPPVNSKVAKIAEAYAKKAISNSSGSPGGKVSIGTQASKWTKMAGERSKIARSKMLTARPYIQVVGDDEEEERISKTQELEGYLNGGYQYSSRATQVCHDVSRGLFNEEEDEEMKERIVSFIQAGNILDRTCPGCYRVLAKSKNLIIHLQSQHSVRLAGSLGETLHNKHVKENEATMCPVCQITLSRKSLRRHLRNKHNQT